MVLRPTSRQIGKRPPTPTVFRSLYNNVIYFVIYLTRFLTIVFACMFPRGFSVAIDSIFSGALTAIDRERHSVQHNTGTPRVLRLLPAAHPSTATTPSPNLTTVCTSEVTVRFAPARYTVKPRETNDKNRGKYIYIYMTNKKKTRSFENPSIHCCKFRVRNIIVDPGGEGSAPPRG